jgi:hypothetical protein
MKHFSTYHPGQAAKRREPEPMRCFSGTERWHGSRLALRLAGMTDERRKEGAR